MKMSNEQMHWMVKVFQPDRTAASLPGVRHRSLSKPLPLCWGSTPTTIPQSLPGSLRARKCQHECPGEPDVGAMVDRLPFSRDARIFAFGDSRTSDPQSWAVILQELISARRPTQHLGGCKRGQRRYDDTWAGPGR